MKLHIEKNNENIKINLKKKEIMKNILKKLNISISSCIIIRNDEIILEEELVSNEDDIKIINVVSGG